MSTVIACLTFTSHDEFLRWQAAEFEMRKEQPKFTDIKARSFIYEDWNDFPTVVRLMGETLRRDFQKRTELIKEIPTT